MSNVRGSALVCSDDARLKEAVETAGYVVTVAPTCEEALPLVRHDSWTVVVIDEATGRDTLRYVHGLPGVRRRDLFVVRVGERYETGDGLQGWCESVDLVVATADFKDLRKHIGDGMRAKEEFYHRFRAIQRESGALLGAHA